MEKRTILALAISLVVLGLYPLVMERLYPNYYKSASSPKPAVQAAEKTLLRNPLTSAAIFLPEDDTIFDSGKVRLVFNRKGGAIREASFLDFLSNETKGPIRFFSLSGVSGAPSAIHFLDGQEEQKESPSYEIVRPSSEEVVASAVQGPLKITKRYRFHEAGYACDLAVTFENTSRSSQEFRYQLFTGTNIPPRHSIDSQYIEANFYSEADGKPKLQHIRESKAGKSVESHGPVKWVAVKDRHFSIILKPRSETPFTGLEEGLDRGNLRASLVSGSVTLPSGGSVTHDFLFYIGPNDLKELLPYELDTIVNFGKLDAIGKLLVGALELLQGVFKNYGVAIIVLTILINILLFPLTRASYMSMKRMQLVQPQMNKLREQHKKSPEKLNREMMELYKKHKVNPFGGCLPMVLQMPVFIALYVALSKYVMLVDSKFLWAKDLSSPDSVGLPFALPFLGDSIHVLPLIMVAGMVLQQRLTQIKMEGQDPAMQAQQKMMAVMMPILFGFIFYSMPSGLVLYWLTNTFLMTGYQLYLKKVTLA